jgi:hypothetical protein
MSKITADEARRISTIKNRSLQDIFNSIRQEAKRGKFYMVTNTISEKHKDVLSVLGFTIIPWENDALDAVTISWGIKDE